MKNLFVLPFFVVCVIGVNIPVQVMSQEDLILTQKTDSPEIIVNPIDLNRAKNYARQAAERANGGLSNYRAEPAMHGPAFDSPYYNNANGTITFSFYGSQPGSSKFIYESIITISLDDFSVYVEYNGLIRNNSNIDSKKK